MNCAKAGLEALASLSLSQTRVKSYEIIGSGAKAIEPYPVFLPQNEREQAFAFEKVLQCVNRYLKLVDDVSYGKRGIVRPRIRAESRAIASLTKVASGK